MDSSSSCSRYAVQPKYQRQGTRRSKDTLPSLSSYGVKRLAEVEQAPQPEVSPVEETLTAPEPVVTTQVGDCSLVNGYDWDVRTAYAVCMGESSNDPTNHNYSDDTRDDSWGLFQINLYGDLKYSRPSPERLVDPAFNVNYAYGMWSHGGWSQWGAYTSGKYLAYMR